MNSSQPPRQEQLKTTLLKLNARAWGIALGLLLGLGLALATIVLVFRGGPSVGPHLSLLALFLPGYSVSIAGAFIGFAYLFVIGYAIGRLIGSVYNKLARSD
jgi:tetrahydromethanopterin S-methyltransferase subunit B